MESWPASFLSRVARLPGWLRPIVWGALTTETMAIFFLLRWYWHLRVPYSVAQIIELVVVAAIAGASGGGAYSLIGRPLRGIPRFGPYLAGIVCGFGWIFPIALVRSLVNPVADDSFNLATPMAAGIWAGIAIVIGLIMGEKVFKAAPAPTRP